MKELTLVGIIFAMIFVAFTAIAYWLGSFSCHNRWEDSSFPVRFELFKGCQIQTKDGWIPADKFRSVD